MTDDLGDNRPRTEMSGGRALAVMLKSHGVGPLFGMGGWQLLPFYDALADVGLEHWLINDERAGAFAADAYARVSQKPGVCDGTLGPGATNLATGLVESLNAGVPVIALIGGTHRGHSWKNLTQEARQTEILRPAVKELIRIEDGARIPELVRRAFEIATSGRPGPVILEVPEDVCHGRHGYSVDALGSDPAVHTFPSRRARPDASDVVRAAALIAGAKRPIVLAGGGVHLSEAQHQLTRFAEALGVPVAHTLSGKGAIACTHPLSVGLFGRYSRIANELIAASDCILVAGCKLGEIATKRYALPPEDIPLIHLEVVAEEIGRVRSPEVALWGDARAGLEDISAELADSTDRQREARAAYTHEVAERMERWRAAVAPRLATDERPIAMPRLVNELNRMLPAEAVLVADGGFAAHWTGLLYDSKRPGRCYVANRGFASIGYGLPGAIGAKLAEPTHPVVAVTGDGGFNMSLGELETARRAKAPVVVIVVNNAASGYVKALQQAVFDGHFQSSDLSEMDYAAIAEAMGCHGHRVEDPSQLAGALTKALGQDDAPSVIDVVVTRDPAAMLPGVDSRVAEVREGDRIA